MNLLLQVLLWILVNGLTLMISARLTAFGGAQSRSMTLVLWTFWWIFVDTSMVLVLGMAGFLNVWAIVVASALVAFLSGACSSANGRFVAVIIRSSLAALRTVLVSFPLYSGIWIMMLVVIAARMSLFVWVLPPHDWDVLTYHLPKVVDWVQAGSLVVNDTPVERSFWPGGFELMQVWFSLFWHHDVVIEAAGIPYYMLATGSVYCIARCLNVRRVYAAWSAMLFATTPIIFMNAVSCKNDMPLAALLILATLLLVSLLVNKLQARSQVFTFAAVVGFGTGVKALMVFVLPVLLFVFIVAVWRRRSDIFSHAEKFELMAWYIVFIMSILLAGYWYIRNLLIFNNPTYPVPLNILGHAMPGIGGLQQGKFSVLSMLENFQALWGRRMWDRGPFDPTACFVTGWGWYVTGVGLASSVFALCVNRVYRLIWISFTLSFCLVLGFVTPDPWNMRFVQWYPAVMCIACGVVLQNLQIELVRRSLLLLAVLCGMLNLGGSLNNAWFTREDWVKHATIPWRQKSIVETHSMISQRVPHDEPLAYIVGGNDPVYCLYGPEMERSLRYIRLENFGYRLEYPDFRTLVIQSGCRYFYFPRSEESPRIRNIFTDQVAAGRFADLGGDVYKVSNAK